MTNKRGISPLIASVLLVAFVILIGSIVIFWGRSFIKERAQKEGELAEKQLKCENVEIEIKNAKKIERNIEIENKGNTAIDGFILRVVSGGTSPDFSSIKDAVDSIPTVGPSAPSATNPWAIS